MTSPKSERTVKLLAGIAVLSIYSDDVRNPRGSWEYDTEPNPKWRPDGSGGKAGLYEDIMHNGCNTPVWVAVLDLPTRKAIHAQTGLWYDFRVIRGHRRLKVLRRLHELYPNGRLNEETGRTVHFGTVDVQAYSGLSEADEIELMIDQIHVKGLSQWGQYLAVKKLAMLGLSEPAIGVRIGKSRGFVQDQVRVMKLPQIVEDSFRLKCEGKPAPNLTRANLIDLYQEMGADDNEGSIDVEGGPRFLAAWDKLTTTGKVEPKPVNVRTRETIITMCKTIKNAHIVGCLKWCAGDTIDLLAIKTEIDTLTEKAAAWEAYLVSRQPAPTGPATDPTGPATDPTEPDPTEPDPTELDSDPTELDSAGPAPTELDSAEPDPTELDSDPTELDSAEPDPTGPAPTGPATDVASQPFEPEPTRLSTRVRKGNGKRGKTNA